MRFINKKTFFIALLTVSFCYACNDDVTQLGLNVLPSDDSVSYITTDTFQLDPQQVTVDIEKLSTHYYFNLGEIDDALYGNINASFYTEFRAVGISDTLKGAKVDSVVGYFESYAAYKPLGDPTSYLYINVNEANAPFDTINNSSYRNGTYIGKNLGGFKAYFASYDTLYGSFRLPNSFGEKLLKLDSTDLYFADSLRKNSIYGLVLSTGLHTGKGAIGTFGMSFYVYYSSSFVDSGRVAFALYDNTYNVKGVAQKRTCKRANYISYNHAKASVNTDLNGLKDDSLFYCLTSGGRKLKLDFSSVRTLYDPKYTYLVGEAKLMLPYSNAHASDTYIPDSTLIPYFNYYGEFLSYSNMGFATILGNTKNVYLEQYEVDVTEYVQFLLNNKYKKYTSLYLAPQNSAYNISKAIFKRKGLKLIVKYSKFPNI